MPEGEHMSKAARARKMLKEHREGKGGHSRSKVAKALATKRKHKNGY